MGDGFALTDRWAGVLFDLGGAGTKLWLSWTAAASDDAWLVLDRNGNGYIDDGTELFGNRTPQPSVPEPNGFLALAEYDQVDRGGNGDGVISASDAIWPELRLWRDANRNGVSEPGELMTLDSVGITELELQYKERKWVDIHGNQFRYRAKVRTAKESGVDRWAFDVFLLLGTP